MGSTSNQGYHRQGRADRRENRLHINDGWLKPAEYKPSPNCDIRPDGEISLIVVHNISLPAGHFGNHYVEQLFCNQLAPVHSGLESMESMESLESLKGVRVSSHLMIRRTGEVIQFVPFDRRAWHAGQSSYQARPDCNDFSVGIELEGTDNAAYRKVQYLALARICKLLRADYDIGVGAIVGHSDIAPGRKTDPGPSFDWPYFRDLLRTV